LSAKEDGRVKLYLTSRALHCCRDHSGLFSNGDYIPLKSSGQKAEHVFAFARHGAGQWAIVVVPRLIARLQPDPCKSPTGIDVWADTSLLLEEIPSNLRWRNVFTGDLLTTQGDASSLGLAKLLADFPVALLLSADSV